MNLCIGRQTTANETLTETLGLPVAGYLTTSSVTSATCATPGWSDPFGVVASLLVPGWSSNQCAVRIAVRRSSLIWPAIIRPSLLAADTHPTLSVSLDVDRDWRQVIYDALVDTPADSETRAREALPSGGADVTRCDREVRQFWGDTSLTQCALSRVEHGLKAANHTLFELRLLLQSQAIVAALL